MIVTSDSETEVKQAELPPQFTADAPQLNPLAASFPIAVTKHSVGVTLEFVNDIPQEGLVRGNGTITDRMIARSEREVARRPQSARAHTNLGIALLNVGNIADAQRQFEIVLATDPAHYIALMNLARTRIDQNRFDEAEEIYLRLREHYPNDPAPVLSLAHMAIRNEQYEAAAKLLRESIQLGHKAITAKHLLGVVLLKLGNNREAISILRSAAHLEVREPAVYEALGVAYIIDGNCRRAALAFKTALSLTPWARNAVHGLAKSLLELKQIDEVLALLVGYVERKPQDIEAKQMLAKAYACRGQFRSAIAQLTQIWSSVENNESTLRLRATLANNIGGYYLDDGEKQQAEQWFGKAIAIAPKESPIPYDNLARVWLRNGETRRAFDIAKHAQEQFGNNPDTMCVLASCFEKVGLYDEAIAQIKPIVESGTATANIHAQLGGLLTEGGSDREAALTFLKEAFKKFKTNEIVANNLAYAYLLTGDAESARPIIEKCLRNLESQWTQPIHTICLTATYGLLRIIEGDLEEGIRLYRRAEKLCPQLGLKEFANTVIQKMHLELARAYFRKHEYQRAKGEVRKGLAVRDGKMIYEQQLLALENQLASMGGAVGD